MIKFNFIFFGLFIFLSFRAPGQGVDTAKRHYKYDDLVRIQNGNDAMLGEFCQTNGFGEICYSFTAGGRAILTDFGCMSPDFHDTGRFETRKKNILVQAARGRNKFAGYQFGKFGFLVLLRERKKFKRQFERICEQIYKYRDQIDGPQRYTDQFYIAFALREECFVRGLE